MNDMDEWDGFTVPLYTNMMQRNANAHLSIRRYDVGGTFALCFPNGFRYEEQLTESTFESLRTFFAGLKRPSEISSEASDND